MALELALNKTGKIILLKIHIPAHIQDVQLEYVYPVCPTHLVAMGTNYIFLDLPLRLNSHSLALT